MLAAGIKSPVPLEELEIHLREEIERQMKSGSNEQKAFEISVQQIGQPKVLDNEFKKSERTFMKRIGINPWLLPFCGRALADPGSFRTSDDALLMANGKLSLWLLGRNFEICWSDPVSCRISFSK